MANRYPDEDERPWMGGQEQETERRRGGSYGLGGAERGYNRGGYGDYEEGYTPGSYDRLLDMTEQYYGQADVDYGRAREEDERYWYDQERDRWSHQTYGGREPDEDERYGARAVGFGRDSWSDEWQGAERARGGWDLREGHHARDQGLREPHPRRGWSLREGLHHQGQSAREAFRGGALEWTARSRGVGKAPKGYQRSDERIRENICELLMNSPYDASNVEITVNRGEVTLTGTVRRRAEKWGIEDMAEAVLGVNDVHNQIRIDRSEAQEPGLSTETDTRGLHS